MYLKIIERFIAVLDKQPASAENMCLTQGDDSCRAEENVDPMQENNTAEQPYSVERTHILNVFEISISSRVNRPFVLRREPCIAFAAANISRGFCRPTSLSGAKNKDG